MFSSQLGESEQQDANNLSKNRRLKDFFYEKYVRNEINHIISQNEEDDEQFIKPVLSQSGLLKSACAFPVDDPYVKALLPEKRWIRERRSVTPIYQTDFTIGVYYYPWHGNDFHGEQYLRQNLYPAQLPLLGQYDDQKCDVVAQHMVWSHQYNINLWVTSWWGPKSRANKTLRDNILTNPLIGDLKVAIHYETSGRTKYNSTSEPFTSLHNIESDLLYLAENYFNHSNYLRINNRPVVVIYLARALSLRNMLVDVVGIMRSSAATKGYDLYIIADFAYGSLTKHRRSSQLPDMNHFDAVTNYDAYGSMGIKESGELYCSRTTCLENYFSDQSAWADAAHSLSKSYIPGVTPGYNDRGVRDGHSPMSRRLDNEDSEPGSLFAAMLKRAFETVDKSTGNMILINSFNEWHEDTQIEPLQVTPATSSFVLKSQILNKGGNYLFMNYTKGVTYEGYGMRYLKILDKMVKEARLKKPASDSLISALLQFTATIFGD